MTTHVADPTCEDKVYDGQPMSPRLYYGGIVGKRVLDVGCGSGNLGAVLQRQGNECYGVTLSQSEAALAKDKLTQIIVGDVETLQALPFPERFFDVVIFADILEHLKNPIHVLKLVKHYLKPQGLVIASIPNVAHVSIRFNLFRGRFDYTSTGILDNTHLRFYTQETAKTLLASSGYLIREMKVAHSWRFPGLLRLFSFCEWEIQERLARFWPGLFAMKFVFYATPEFNP